MIDIFIDDDGKVTIKTTNGLTETEVAATVVLEAMRNLKSQKRLFQRFIYYTYKIVVLQNCNVLKLSRIT